MMYEAMTGRIPFSGSVLMIGDRKRTGKFEPLQHVDPHLPADLCALCERLLEHTPGNRLTGLEFSSSLGPPPSVRRSVLVTYEEPDDLAVPFVGRHESLAQMHRVFEDVLKSHRGEALVVYGESGIGKSTIVKRFQNDVRNNYPEVIVFSGRCYEHESIPYKAIDGVIDALSRYLSRLSDNEVSRLLPNEAALLPRSFPVLGKVESISKLSAIALPGDAHELRYRVFGALCGLLRRVAQRGPLLIMIDDIQWSDIDSGLLLEELFRSPLASPLMLVCTFRTESPDHPSLPYATSHLRLSHLDAQSSKELANALLTGHGTLDEAHLNKLIQESSGHPLFLHEVIRHARRSPETATTYGSSLDAALTRRLTDLDASSRRVLQIVVVSPVPLTEHTITNASELMPDDVSRCIKILKLARWLRLSDRAGGSTSFEVYHDRIGTVVRSQLTVSDRTEIHRRLAMALERDSVDDPESLAMHWREAGDPRRAVRYLALAGNKARDALAFDRAASFYQAYLDLERTLSSELDDQTSTRPIKIQLAGALAGAVRCKDAADVYLHLVSPEDRNSEQYKRLAAELLFRSGYIDEAVEQLSSILADAGIRMARTPFGALLSFVVGRFWLWVWSIFFGALNFKTRREDEIDPKDLKKLDACWMAATGLFTVDQIQGADFQTRHLIMALRVGEPHRVAYGYALEANISGSWPVRRKAKFLETMEKARALGASLNDPYVRGLIHMEEGVEQYFDARWTTCFEELEISKAAYPITSLNQFMGEKCAAWLIQAWALCQMGKFNLFPETIEPQLEEAKRRGDLSAIMSLGSGYPNAIWLLRDKPDVARKEASGAITQWSQRGFHLQHFFDLFAQCHIDMYEGNYISAYNRLTRDLVRMRRSLLLMLAMNRILTVDLYIRAMIGVLVTCDSDDVRKRLTTKARKTTKKLGAEAMLWTNALQALSEGGLDTVEGLNDRARANFGKAIGLFTDLDMAFHAATARRCLASLSSGEEARVLKAESDRYFTDQHVVNPQRFMAILAPWWREDYEIIYGNR